MFFPDKHPTSKMLKHALEEILFPMAHTISDHSHNVGYLFS